nr:MAG TPA: hypothetical protein [Caudoviricetes sp.]
MWCVLLYLKDDTHHRLISFKISQLLYDSPIYIS